MFNGCGIAAKQERIGDQEARVRQRHENETLPLCKMFIELLVLFAIVVAICFVAYRSAIHEFQILQKDYEADTEWAPLLSEQLPLVIRDVPPSWLGSWTYGKTGNKTWPVFAEKDEKQYKVAWNAYLAQAAGTEPIVEDFSELSASVKLLPSFQNWIYDGFTRPWWLPVQTPTPYLFTDKKEVALEKTKAEWTVIVSTDGAPLELWVSHEGAIPDEVYDEEDPINPWTATTATIPWIGDVKYIEIKLRPGNALLLPRHWWVAIRKLQGEEAPSLNAHGAWWWKGEFHSIMSQCVSSMSGLYVKN